MINLNDFVEWSNDNPRCKIQIEIGGYKKEDAGKVQIWIYDSALGVGQFVLSVDEINLESEYKKNMEQKRQEVEKYFQKEKVV